MKRRTFLAGTAVAGLVACGEEAAPRAAAPARVPFDGPRQAGVAEAPPEHATFAALDSVAATRGDLATTLQALSYRARQLARGGRYTQDRREDLPRDSGTLGPVADPDGLTITIALGQSFFDRHGLAAPNGLRRMPTFAGDELEADRTHGDVLMQLRAAHRATLVHALRELLRATRGGLELRWMLDGFQTAGRNLFGFRDGTVQPAADGVWDGDATFAVVRTMRMHVEFWDRIGLTEQENIIGRTRDSGARIARQPDSHVVRARAAGAKLLRRSYSYQRGFDPSGALDQGLAFVAYARDLRQFEAVQQRLAGEPMTDYATTVGGGYYYVPPGTGGTYGWVGESLFS